MNIPEHIINENALSPADRFVLAKVEALAKKRGYCSAQNRTLAGYVNIPFTTVRRSINYLLKTGFLSSILERRNSRNLYITYTVSESKIIQLKPTVCAIKGQHIIKVETGGDVQNGQGGMSKMDRGDVQNGQGDVQNGHPYKTRDILKITKEEDTERVDENKLILKGNVSLMGFKGLVKSVYLKNYPTMGCQDADVNNLKNAIYKQLVKNKQIEGFLDYRVSEKELKDEFIRFMDNLPEYLSSDGRMGMHYIAKEYPKFYNQTLPQANNGKNKVLNFEGSDEFVRACKWVVQNYPSLSTCVFDEAAYFDCKEMRGADAYFLRIGTKTERENHTKEACSEMVKYKQTNVNVFVQIKEYKRQQLRAKVSKLYG